MKKTTLGKLLKIKQGYAFKSENYIDSGLYRLCTLGNFSMDNNFRFNDEKANYYPDEFPHEFILKAGDLILPMTEQAEGLFGNSAFVPESDAYEFVLNQRVGKVIVDSEIVNIHYLHFLLSTNGVRKQLETSATGTQQRNTSPEKIYDVQVWIPDSIKYQENIGDMLYKIEKLININNRINDYLEQQALLIFRHMFYNISYGSNHVGDYITPRRGKALLSKDAIPGCVPVIAGGLVPATYHNVSNTVAPVLTISGSGANAGYINIWYDSPLLAREP